MKYNLTKDMSVLTTVPVSNLKSLCEVANTSISHDVFESVQSGADETEVNIGIGTLVIKSTQDYIKYRFIPNRSLDDKIKSSVEGNDPLSKAIEESFKSKLMTTYKELF